MKGNNNILRISQLFLGVFLFACVTYISARVLPHFLMSKGLSIASVEKFELTEMLGYIIAGLFLTSTINKINYPITAITSLTILVVGLLLLSISNYTILKINFIITSIAYYTYITTTIIRILEISDNKHTALIALSLSWVLGNFIIYFLDIFFIIASKSGLLSCIGLYIIMIVMCIKKQDIDITPQKFISKFSFLVGNIELQLLTGFITTYVTFEILWFYEDFALLSKFSLSDTWSLIHYILIGIFLFLSPIIYLFQILNKYITSLVLVIILFVSFALLPYYGTIFSYNILLLSIIGLCLCAVFICNILILSDKFSGEDYRTTLALYFTMCAIGMYSGALSADISCEDYNCQNFLFSTFTVVGIFILYNLWSLFNQKLYKL
ncbi:MAG: hypothetical protein LN588_02555 [Rickettsia endosymbiont of Bryobia graminum]|nr:hypothetical protein [Rickettsia endosymbiont of Bryobia graminum]